MLILGPGAAILILAGEAGLGAEAILAGTAIAGGTSAASIIRAGNADPYFVVADTRPNSDIATSPVEITRVTGGLSAPPSLAPAPGAAITGTGTTSAGTTDLSAGLPPSGEPLYDDDPVPFVGGSLPKGAQPIGDWTWDNTRMYGAMPTHTQAGSDGSELHYFTHAANPLKLDENSNIVQYVYLDPAGMPAELYMQFYTGKGDGEHRAYWGQDKVQTGGTSGTASLYPMGSMPAGGGWVRLQIPAGKLGLAGTQVSGVLFGLYGGKAWWGPTTTSNYLLDNSPGAETVQAPPAVPTTTLGAQIAYRLAGPASVSLEVVDAQGKHIRTLQNGQDELSGYYVAVWDAKDDNGATVQDAPYSVRISTAGNVAAQRGITVTPLVAHILTPGQDSLVRGDQVPVIAEAYGEHFSSYTLEYGQGISPQSWYTLTFSESPTLLPTARELKQFNPGNLANWDVGVNEFKPWNEEGLNGVYTLRLLVDGDDGRQATDTTTVIVGRLAHTAEGGTITSPDGKARITIPELATTEAFALMALVPESQLDPGDSWRSSLPADATLAGDMYEVFPAGERFRRDVTLELPVNGGADTSHIGIMLGDGTPSGWRYIGGTYDSQKGVVSVPVTGFGGGRALAAVFTSGSFGPTPADPAANAKLQIAAADQAPLITSAGASGSLFAFYSDMDLPGEWESLDISGTQLTRVQGADAGVADGDAVLKVTRLPGGVRLVRVHSTPYDAAKFPVLSFDYQLPNDYIPDLFVKSNDIWWQLSLGSSAPVDTTYFKSLGVPKLVGDGAWHHYSVDLLSLLQNVQPEGTHFQVSDIVLGQFIRTAYMQVEAADSGQVGSAYYIDNFAALAPTNAANLNLSWAAPSGVSFVSYAYGLDPDRSFTPAQRDQGASTSAGVSLPQDLTGGLYYFHLMAKRADGSWSPVAHLPIMLDRTAPAAGTVASPVDGLGASSLIELPLADLSGVAAGSIQVKLGGQTYRIGSGLTYDPVLQSIEITPNSLKPAPASFTGGQGVAVTLLAASDHAGNKLAAPYTWSFTADSQLATGDKFRQLTVQGGSSPAISPDGTLLAFVSVRSGTPKICLMQASDYGEKAAGAKALTGAVGSQESDPAWSLDGQTLAYVSNASGSSQVSAHSARRHRRTRHHHRSWRGRQPYLAGGRGHHRFCEGRQPLVGEGRRHRSTTGYHLP